MSEFSSIEQALAALRRGECIIVLDDDNRENEGDLIIPADNITPENTEKHGCSFTVSVDYRHGTTTGVSSHDRALTIKQLAPGSGSVSSDFNRPGHVFPLQAREGGVLQRAGHTEASVDLAKLSGYSPAGCICEIMNPDGTMARLPELRLFSKKHSLHMITIADLMTYRLTHESFLSSNLLKNNSVVKTPFGLFNKSVFRFTVDGSEHQVLTTTRNTEQLFSRGLGLSEKIGVVFVHVESIDDNCLFGTSNDKENDPTSRSSLLRGISDVAKYSSKSVGVVIHTFSSFISIIFFCFL
eukprot:GSMAST32.ASY1.ANO1.2006.1 assembled CDS